MTAVTIAILVLAVVVFAAIIVAAWMLTDAVNGVAESNADTLAELKSLQSEITNLGQRILNLTP